MGEILELIRNGITVNIAFDVESAVILGLVLLAAGVLIMTVYAKILT
ncbi:hypothetical protein [Phaeodactylibacter sp.]|nr:hypothetical protein [Phaeodactylibacter sp.]MCI4650852.1 hypothetical protein [Phaeodactylibacter sp.]MCI5089809.1 hypothetical protein [Phaeodactylibacter sp.]